MKSTTNIPYKANSYHHKHTLDVYTPDTDGCFPVLLFIHGGSWYHGSKDPYALLGKHLAGKQIVSVMINYRLGNEATYEEMAYDCSQAYAWTAKHITEYKGNPNHIFLAGHSAGGHLAALITLNKRFMIEKQLIKGCILIDAFGLNMDYVMKNNQSFFISELQQVFTKEPGKWIDATPSHFMSENKVPFLIMTGDSTYEYLSLDNWMFSAGLQKHAITYSTHTLKGKNHTGMITAMQDPSDEAYTYLTAFIRDYTV